MTERNDEEKDRAVSRFRELLSGYTRESIVFGIVKHGDDWFATISNELLFHQIFFALKPEEVRLIRSRSAMGEALYIAFELTEHFFFQSSRHYVSNTIYRILAIEEFDKLIATEIVTMQKRQIDWSKIKTGS